MRIMTTLKIMLRSSITSLTLVLPFLNRSIRIINVKDTQDIQLFLILNDDGDDDNDDDDDDCDDDDEDDDDDDHDHDHDHDDHGDDGVDEDGDIDAHDEDDSKMTLIMYKIQIMLMCSQFG